MYFDFFLAHSVDANVAAESTLPEWLIKKRKRKCGASIYCKTNYFELICAVESTYINNLIIEMMMAYAHGNLVHAIKCHLLKDKVSYINYMKTCKNNAVNSEEASRNIIKYILEWYANMWSMHFVNYLKGTGNSSINKVVDAQATIVRIVNAVACPKAVSKVET